MRLILKAPPHARLRGLTLAELCVVLLFVGWGGILLTTFAYQGLPPLIGEHVGGLLMLLLLSQVLLAICIARGERLKVTALGAATLLLATICIPGYLSAARRARERRECKVQLAPLAKLVHELLAVAPAGRGSGLDTGTETLEACLALDSRRLGVDRLARLRAMLRPQCSYVFTAGRSAFKCDTHNQKEALTTPAQAGDAARSPR